MSKMRNQARIVTLDHPVMPVELVLTGDDLEIRTGKTGSQAQLLLDDVAVILTAALKAGVEASDLIESCGDVDPHDAPITRAIFETLKEGDRHESKTTFKCTGSPC